MKQDVLQRLLHSAEPAIQYKAHTLLLGEKDPQKLARLRKRVKASALCRKLLSEVNAAGEIPYHPYKKWNGAHWVLPLLADLGYPPGDRALRPLMDQVYGWLLSEHFKKYLRVINGLTRRCASQESNALHTALSLGLADDRAHELARRLIAWQWPDGGWNCDKDPNAHNSSYHESILPLRALNLYAQMTGDKAARQTVARASELFLKRQLFKRLRDGKPIHHSFTACHYPRYWHYDFLLGLRVMVEVGRIDDPRCVAALDLLESQRLPDGGFPAAGKWYQLIKPRSTAYSLVDWGGASRTRSNDWVTVEALYVLKAAGRWKPGKPLGGKRTLAVPQKHD